MIQLVFVFGVVLPTLITVACFIGFLVCWCRFRSAKRQHATDRKSSSAACPRRCRVYVASASTTDFRTSGFRTGRCLRPSVGSGISTGSSIPVGWLTHVIDRRSDSVVLSPTSDAASVGFPSAADVQRFAASVRHSNSGPGRFRPVSGSRTSTALPGLLLTHHQDPRRTAVSDELMHAAAVRGLSNADGSPPDAYISGLGQQRKKGGRRLSRAVAIDACYVDVEPIVHATESPTSFRERPRMSSSRSDDIAVFKPTQYLATASGLSGNRMYYRASGDSAGLLRTDEIRRPARVRRHHSVAEVLHHRQLQIKTADQTSLDF